MSAPLTANVYVDGFNVFRGVLKGQRNCKWLDIVALCGRLLPQCQVNFARYFTAHVIDPPADPGKSRRQQVYLSALRAQPNTRVHLGRFLQKRVRGSLLDATGSPTWVMREVLTLEEKGSDVNLATYLLIDAFDERANAAIVISNDPDLSEPIRRVRGRFGLDAAVLNPTSHRSRALQSVATSYKSVTLRDVGACQLPDPVVDQRGRKIRKPVGW